MAEVIHISFASPEEDAAWERGVVEGLELRACENKWSRATLKEYAESQHMQDVPMIKALIESWPTVYGKE
jgi:hypothetical protein